MAKISNGVFPQKLVPNLKETIISDWKNWLNTHPKRLLVLNQELLRGYILVAKYASGPFYNASLDLRVKIIMIMSRGTVSFMSVARTVQDKLRTKM